MAFNSQPRQDMPEHEASAPKDTAHREFGTNGLSPNTSDPAVYGSDLLTQHVKLLVESAISPEVAAARGYRSITKKVDLESKGFVSNQRNVPGLLIPIHNAAGQLATYQYRPDQPRINKDGKPVKYETPFKSRLVLDVPPMARPQLSDPSIPLLVTEGSRKADAAVSRGLCCVALLGVWGFRGRNEHGGKAALPDWEHVALNNRQVYVVFDSDVMTKPGVYAALVRLKAFLESRHA